MAIILTRPVVEPEPDLKHNHEYQKFCHPTMPFEAYYASHETAVIIGMVSDNTPDTTSSGARARPQA